MFSILVACTANVCRSPLAAFSLERSLTHLSSTLPSSSEADSQGVIVSSAGTKARPGRAVCAKVEEAISDHPSGVMYARQHVARQVTSELVDAADLILVADFANRSRIAQLSPLARHRTFTLLEAASILNRVASNSLSSTDVAGVMRERRSEAGIDGSSTRWFQFRQSTQNTLDIPDGHVLGAGQHRRTLKQATHAGSEVAESLFRVAGLRT